MDRLLRALMLGALISATAAGAQTVYKSRNPDGSVVYSDMPPADGKVDKIIEFADLPNSVVPPLPGDSHPTAVSGGPVKHAVIMMHTPQGARVYQRDISPAQPLRRRRRLTPLHAHPNLFRLRLRP